jgi:hypothetical protein
LPHFHFGLSLAVSVDTVESYGEDLPAIPVIDTTPAAICATFFLRAADNVADFSTGSDECGGK